MGFWGTMGKVFSPKNIGTAAGAVGGSFVGQPALGASLGRSLGGAFDGEDNGNFVSDAAEGYGIGAMASAAGMFASDGGVTTAAAPSMAAPAAPEVAGANVAAMSGMDMASAPAASVMSAAPDSGLAANAQANPAGLPPAQGLTGLEKAFLISQIAGTAGDVYGGLRADQRHRSQSRAAGNTMGRMLRDSMNKTYSPRF